MKTRYLYLEQLDAHNSSESLFYEEREIENIECLFRLFRSDNISKVIESQKLW